MGYSLHFVLIATLLQCAAGFVATAPAMSRPLPGRATLAAGPRVAPLSCVESEGDGEGSLVIGAAVAGLIAQPITAWSLYTVWTTGAGLEAGPFGLLGLAEGLSFLIVPGFVFAALLTKVKTGSGLPAGPAGLLGAAEGLSFLSFIGIIVVFGLQAAGIAVPPRG